MYFFYECTLMCDFKKTVTYAHANSLYEYKSDFLERKKNTIASFITYQTVPSVDYLSNHFLLCVRSLVFVITVWTQDDLLKLLEAMKVALPQKDLTKYKTSESHLDWQKVAFNSYTAEMCKQKWQEVSKEVRHIFFFY